MTPSEADFSDWVHQLSGLSEKYQYEI